MTFALSVFATAARSDDTVVNGQIKEATDIIPKKVQDVIHNIDTIVQNLNINNTFTNSTISIGAHSFVSLPEGLQNKQPKTLVEPFVQWISGGSSSALLNNTTPELEYISYVKGTLSRQLIEVKSSILEHLIIETSDFLTYFNQSASLLRSCNWTCVTDCVQTHNNSAPLDLLVQRRVACLDQCACYAPGLELASQDAELQTTLESAVDTTTGEQLDLETLPASNKTLEKIAEKVKIGQNLTTEELRLQRQVARTIYDSEIQFERSAMQLEQQQELLNSLKKIFPAQYVDHLQKEIQHERDQLVREQLNERVRATVDSILSDTTQKESTALNVIHAATKELGCNQTCIVQCEAIATDLHAKFACLEVCQCFLSPEEKQANIAELKAEQEQAKVEAEAEKIAKAEAEAAKIAQIEKSAFAKAKADLKAKVAAEKKAIQAAEAAEAEALEAEATEAEATEAAEAETAEAAEAEQQAEGGEGELLEGEAIELHVAFASGLDEAKSSSFMTLLVMYVAVLATIFYGFKAMLSSIQRSQDKEGSIFQGLVDDESTSNRFHRLDGSPNQNLVEAI